MKYYQWLDERSADPNDSHWHVDFPGWCWEEWAINQGKAVSNWDPSLVGSYPPYGEPVDFPGATSDWHIHSPRLRQLFEKHLPNQIQYLPFRLEASVGTGSIEGYCIANYLNLIDCLDRQRTEVENHWKPISPAGDFGVVKAVLSRSCLGNAKLFPVLGDSTLVIARDDMKNLIEESRITGSVFQELEVSD